MEADAEELLATPAGRGSEPVQDCASAGAESSGPRSFEQAMAWPNQIADDMASHHAGLYANLRGRLSEPLVVTTHFSGIGCAEVCVSMLQERFHSGSSPRVRFYSACESDREARALLLHRGGSEPEHVFGDILSRIPLDTLQRLRQIQFDAISQSGSLCEQARDECGSNMLGMMCRVLDSCKFVEKDWCYKHQTKCCLKPTVPPGTQHGDITGSTCVAWSTLNKSGGRWLHESTLPCLVWIYWLLCSQPSWYLHECVQNFDHRTLAELLKTKYCTFSFCSSPRDLGLPANRWRRYTFGFNAQRILLHLEVLDSENGGAFDTLWEQLIALGKQEAEDEEQAAMSDDPQQQEATGSEQGATRDDEDHQQQAAAGDLPQLQEEEENQDKEKELMDIARERLQRDLPDMYSEMFKRRVSTGCEMYLQAPRSLVARYVSETCAARGLVFDSDDAAADGSMSSLSGACFQRLVSYKKTVQKACDPERLRQFPWFVVNLQHTASFQPNVSHIVPALLTQSCLVMMRARRDDVSSNRTVQVPASDVRLVLPLDHFAIMSFPITFTDSCSSHSPGHPASEWGKFFPWSVSWLLENCTSKDLRKLIGNGMHLHALGSALALMLAMCVPIRENESADGHLAAAQPAEPSSSASQPECQASDGPPKFKRLRLV